MALTSEYAAFPGKGSPFPGIRTDRSTVPVIQSHSHPVDDARAEGARRPAQQRSDNPTHPSATPTRTGFARALRELRLWSGLTLEEIRDLQPRLRVATSSDYERALRFPGWEWVYDFVSTCLTHPKPPHRPLAPHRLRGELEHWQTAWVTPRNTPHPSPSRSPSRRHENTSNRPTPNHQTQTGLSRAG